MPSADFCMAVRGPRGPFSPEYGTPYRPPEVSPTTFPAYLPDLQPLPLMDMDFVVFRQLVRLWLPDYPVPVRQVTVLLHASFRHDLTTTPLRFANSSPPSGCVESLHLQVIEHARRTKEAYIKK